MIERVAGYTHVGAVPASTQRSTRALRSTRAFAPIARHLLLAVERGVAREPPEHATRAAARALCVCAYSQPRSARPLLSDSLSSAGRLRDARDELVDDAARIVEQAHRRLPLGAVVPQLPPRLVLGSSCRLLAYRLRGAAEPRLELDTWIAAYEQPLARRTWCMLAALPPPGRSPFLSPRDFHHVFAGRRQAPAAADELLFRHAMAAAAGAYVAGRSWPERVWEAERALLQYFEQHAALASGSLIESRAHGSRAVRRFEALSRAFTIFLLEGDRDPRGRSARANGGVSDLALQAIAAAVLELAYRHVRGGGETPLSALLAQIVFISLAPFMGADAASDFLCSQAHAPLASAA